MYDLRRMIVDRRSKPLRREISILKQQAMQVSSTLKTMLKLQSKVKSLDTHAEVVNQWATI